MVIYIQLPETNPAAQEPSALNGKENQGHSEIVVQYLILYKYT